MFPDAALMGVVGHATRGRIAKAGGADNWVSGMDTATEMLSFLEHIGSDIAGCVMPSKRRDDGETNAQIVEYLAHPNKIEYKRDITPTDEDRAEAAKVIKNIILVKLKMMSASRKGKRLKKWDEAKTAAFVASGKQEANKIAALALRKAGQGMKAAMLARAQSGLYRPVSDGYAGWRLKIYGVSPGRVFVCTGQLLSNLTDGHIKLIKKPDLMKMIGGEITSMIGQGAESLAKAVQGFAK